MNKKIGLLFREISANQIKNNLKESNSVFIVRYSGVPSPDLSSLRQSLRVSDARFFVVKNSIARRAFKEAGLENLIKSIEGPCGLVFIKEEPVSVSRILCTFAREHVSLKLEGGFLKDRVLEKQDIEALSRLPSKEILRTQVVMTIKSPISGLVMALNQVLSKFVWCLEQIKNKKEK
jgi:large subunit ribosomal protein L10